MSSSPPPDADLVQRCLAGDERAWAHLVQRYSDLVYGIARRSGSDAAGAADVVQEVFLALLRGLRRLRKAERLAGWIARTARREAWRQARRSRQARRREGAVARGEPAPVPLPDEVLVQLEEEQAVRDAFAALEERCRRLLDALFFRRADRSYAEVARDLGLAVGSLGPTRRRCLEALRAALDAIGHPSLAAPAPAPRPVSRRGRSASSSTRRP